MWRDLLYGARLFRRQPGPTFLAVLTLSLGIGANAVIYSLLHAALLHPLPFADADRLVGIVDNFRGQRPAIASPTIPELLDLRAASQTLDPISFFDTRDAQINGGNEPARALSARVEAEFLRTLGVQPALGRIFTQDDHQPGRDHVVILSDGFWRRNLGGDAAVINRNIIVNGAPHAIVGVLPPGVSFDYFSEPVDLYVPYPMTPDYTSRAAEFSSVRRVVAIARLKRGATMAQAAAELQTVADRLRADHAQLYRRGSDGMDLGFSMNVMSLRQLVIGGDRQVVLILFVAVGLVLLIACVNTAQFLLARAIERQPEVIIRSALGAGRGQLLRQFLTEAFLLAAVAAVAGLAQAASLMGVLRSMLESRSPLVSTMGINGWVIGFTVFIAVLVTLACGLLPAMHVIGHRFVGDASRLTGPTRSRTRHALIAIQVGVSVVLLVSAGLLVQGLQQLQNAPRGYSIDDVIVMRLRVTGRIPGGSGMTYQRYLQEMSTIPGLASAAFASSPIPGSASTAFSIIGRPDDAATLAQQQASWRIVSPRYFDVLRIPILSGRTFADDDAVGRPMVAVVNEEMARRYWPDQNPIGQQIRSGEGPRLAVTTIVGVAGNVRANLQRDIVPQIYVPYLQQSEPNIFLLARSSAGMPAPIEAIKKAIWSVVPEQPVFDIQPLAAVIDRSMASPRLITRLLSSFAMLALLMSTLGVYTVVSYLTARRTKEVALRRAIGAGDADVLRLLGLRTMAWSLAGLVLGIAGSVSVVGVLRSAVLSSARLDTSMVAMTTGFYLLVVALAVAVPAARALRISPATILRSE